MALAFPLGSSDGDTVCTNVTIASDGLVECEEDFTVEVILGTVEDNFDIGNNSTFVTLTDNDGKSIIILEKTTTKSFCSCILFDSYHCNGF